jgi:hypothetical protein
MRDLEQERRNWESRPERTLVLLVVVDEYVGYGGLEGIGGQAARFAEQLIRYGVEPQNILLLSSEHARGEFPAGVSWLGRMDKATLNAKAIRDGVMDRDAELLWVHWIGHGVYDRSEMKLLTADAEPQMVEVVEVTALRKLLQRDNAVKAKRQMFTIDACQQDWTKAQSIPLREPETAYERLAWQFVMRGSRPGGMAICDTRGGLFTEALMAAVDEVSEPERWPPDVTRLVGATSAWLREAQQDDLEGIQWATDTPWEGPRQREDELRAGGQSRDLVAWAVPDGWLPGAYHAGFGSASQLSLDLRLVANRLRSVVGVAEPVDADLAGDLNRAEEALDALPLGEVPPGRWVTVDLERYGDPSAVPDLGRHVLQPDHWQKERVRGIVLRLDIAVASDVTVRQHIRRERLRAWLRRIDQERPDASIAVAVRAGCPVDALLAARQLAGELDAVSASVDQRGLVTRARPGELAGGSAGTGLAGPPFLPAVVDRLRTEAHRRGLPFPFGDDTTDQGPGAGGRTAPDSATLARAVVAELEQPGFAWSRRPADRDPDEAFLCATRDFAPALFPHLVQAYAAGRTGPGWGVSLAVAAQFDQDLATWLAAATDADRRPDPRDSSHWLPATYGRAPAEALLLELARREPPLREDEQLAAVRPRFAEALQLLRSPPPNGRPAFQPSSTALDVVAILFAASPDPTGLLGPEPDFYAEQTWYAVRAAARTSDGARAMLRLVAGAPDPGFARAVVGLEQLPAGTEVQRRERAAELHRLLHDLSGG